MATPNYVNDFINKLSVLAVAEAKKRKAEGKAWSLPSVCIAQSALETGWGRSDLMIKANAFFGIKASKSWGGKVYSSKTKECYDGVSFTTITALFRAYDSLEESVKDYYDLICNNKRYAGAVGKTDAKECITAIKEGGYATDPEYVDSVMSIVDKYDLTRFDKFEDVKVEAPKKETTLKSVDEVAREVINGKWGNGSDRREVLEKAGYNYSDVQGKVNEILKGETSSNKNKSDYETYTIQAGDTLTKISKLFYGVCNHTTIQKIANANNIPNPNYIRSGVTIKIPR